MKALTKSWLCILTAIFLGGYSLIIGAMLEVGVQSSSFCAHHYLGGKPLPVLTEWFYGLHTDDTHSLLTLAFYPTLITTAYLCCLIFSDIDATQQNGRFALAALSCFICLTCYVLLAAFALVLPFVPMWGGMLDEHSPVVPPLQQGIWVGLIVLFTVNIGLLFRFVILARRSTTPS